MSRTRSRRGDSRRSPLGRPFSHHRPLRYRWPEPLEPRRLLAADRFVELSLVSNQPGTALVTDPTLGFAWGLATSPGANGGFSVSDTSAERSNSYSGDAAGSPFVQNPGQTVFVPLATGQVYNGSTGEFILNVAPTPSAGSNTPPPVTAPAQFIYASLNGNLYGSSPSLGQHAVLAASVKGASFTGLTLAKSANGDQLYATDFSGGKIDVFDASFKPATPSGSFTDPDLPAGYKPFNIQALDNPTAGTELYVSYASSLAETLGSHIPGPLPPVPAPGGVVDVFDVNGSFVGRIASGSPLDQPWGMALAPASFGKYAGDLLVANHGDGKINVFNPTPGATPAASLGVLGGADGDPIAIHGLLGLTLGNGGTDANNAGDSNALYFTAGSLPEIVTPLDGTAGTLASDPSLFVSPISRGLMGAIQVAQTSPFVAVGTSATALAGKPFSGALAAFGSADLPSPKANPLPDNTATIDWGDGGSTSLGTVVPTGGGGYIVVGSHTYSAAGTENYQVTIADDAGNTAVATGTVQVSAAVLLAHALSVDSHNLALSDDTKLATFIDTGGADPLSNYSATINWGDNTTSPGTITAASVVPGSAVVGGYFSVSGGHTYTAAGDYTFTVAISDSDGSTATVTGTVQAAQAALQAKALPITIAGLTLMNTDVAVFKDTGGADPADDYTATIDWGDNSSSSGTILSVVADPPGMTGIPLIGPIFLVQGGHTYAAAGDYTFTVTISDTKDNIQTTVTGTAHVAQAPLLAAGVPVVVTSGLSVDGAIVSAFADGGGGDDASNYSATIDWGDGTSTPADSVSGSGNSFIITGSHTYAASGGYELKISIADQDGSTGTAVAHAFIELPVASYVVNAFQHLLHRTADDAGLSYWTQQINAGMSAAAFAGDLTHSAEYFATNVIAPAYQKYLGRSSDAAGLAYWTSRMQQGLTDQQLQAGFIASPEFYANAGGSDTGWINALYKSVLGRTADGAGLTFWESQLAGGMNRATVAIDFATSQEHAAQAVQNDYFTYLGRTATAAEVNYWVAQFEHGATNEDVISGFVGSPEFVKLHS